MSKGTDGIYSAQRAAQLREVESWIDACRNGERGADAATYWNRHGGKVTRYLRVRSSAWWARMLMLDHIHLILRVAVAVKLPRS